MSLSDIKQLGRYQLDREIGRGSMGVVYLAIDPVIGRTVALKTMEPPPGLDEKRRAEYLERFLQEARAAGGLSHPGIVTVYDAGRDEATGRFFLAMEYVPGRTLDEAFPLPEREAVTVFRAVGAALEYAHRNHVVHRDLKPANILLGEDGSVKITDFGIARVAHSELTRDGESLGSPAYMSPEQVLGRSVDGRSDLFALGVLIYEALTGQRPFSGENLQAIAYQVVHERPRPVRDVNPDLSPAWEGLLGRLLAKRPEERQADAGAFLRDLASVLPAGERPTGDRTQIDESFRVAAPPVEPAIWAQKLGASRPAQIALAGLVLTMGLAFLVLARGDAVRMQVDFRHGIEEGRLRVHVDGSTLVDLRFVGTERREGGPKGGSTRIPLQLRPGEHDFVVEVVSTLDGEEWSRTVTRTLPEDGETILEIRVDTKFHPGLSLDWRGPETAG